MAATTLGKLISTIILIIIYVLVKYITNQINSGIIAMIHMYRGLHILIRQARQRTFCFTS